MRMPLLRSMLLLTLCSIATAQERPFLFTHVIPSGTAAPFIVHYDAAYGRGTFEPLGGDNMEQTLGMQTPLSGTLTLIGRIGLAAGSTATRTSQHVELHSHLLSAGSSLVDASIGGGFRHEYSGTNVLLLRAAAGRTFDTWQLYGNMLLERPLSGRRDAVDLFLTTGWSHTLSERFRFGFEAVGQDLEGFWEEEEAEGGATLFVGPTIAAALPSSPWSFTLGAGPILRATRSARTSFAPRDLPPAENGFVIHAAITMAL